MMEQPVPNPESEMGQPGFSQTEAMLDLVVERQDDAAERIATVLDRHVRDIEPAEEGSRELVRQLESAAIGMAGAEIQRPEPTLRVDGVVSLERGKSLVLVGRNGSGKSTALDAMMEIDGAFISTRKGAGAVVFHESVHARDQLRIARLNQEELLEPIAHLPAGRVLQEVAGFFRGQLEVDEAAWSDPDGYERNLKNQDAQVRIDNLMGRITKMFEMEQFLDTPVQHLSGGERTKLSLFMMLLSEPDVLLLDEPTNHLDLKSIAMLTGLIENYKNTGSSILSASHVNWFLEEVGDRVVEVKWDKSGRQLQQTNSRFPNFLKNRERANLGVIQGEVEWFSDAPRYAGQIVITSPSQFTIPNSPVSTGMPHIHGGELVVLSGDNGTGKTKIMETIVANRREDLPRREKGVNIAYLPQFWPAEVVNGNVGNFFEWVRQGANPYSRGAATNPELNADRLFLSQIQKLQFGGARRVGQNFMQAPFAKFSGGEQRLMWFIAVSALRDIDVLLLDEPTNHMDQDSQGKVADAIAKFPGAVLMSTHDRLLTHSLFASQDRSGQGRHPKHWIITKQNGQSRLEESKVDPVTYIETMIRDAKQRAKRLVMQE